jgi:hypothetical protein
MTKHKTCPDCLTELKSTYFPLDRPYTIYECSCSFWRFEDGQYHFIKKKEKDETHTEYTRKWRHNHREQNREYHKKWQKEHPEQCKEYMRKFYQKHPEYMKKYEQEHREQLRESNQKYYRKHKKVKE